MSTSYIPKALRELVAAQARYRCGYCLTQELIIGTPMDVEHIIPEALNGLTEESNLWLACSICNKRKGDRLAARDPVTDELVPLFDPRRQVWSEHFVWIEQGLLIVGLTPMGRATVVALHLNRQALVRSRRLWISAGWHPPTD
jgi:HNH endonuclease